MVSRSPPIPIRTDVQSLCVGSPRGPRGPVYLSKANSLVENIFNILLHYLPISPIYLDGEYVFSASGRNYVAKQTDNEKQVRSNIRRGQQAPCGW